MADIIRLLKNGKLYIEDTNDNVMPVFEDRVTLWNNETSGWDIHGNFWSVKEVPVDSDPDRSVPSYLGGLVS